MEGRLSTPRGNPSLRRQQRALNTFLRRLLKAYPREVQGVLLYDSLARGLVGSGGAVTFLVISQSKELLSTALQEMCEEVDKGTHFSTMLVPLVLRPREVREGLAAGDPFLVGVFSRGKVLYDDGTLASLRLALSRPE